MNLFRKKKGKDDKRREHGHHGLHHVKSGNSSGSGLLVLSPTILWEEDLHVPQ